MSNQTTQQLLEQAALAQQRAYAPYSNFAVGCAIAADQLIFNGCNVENVSYGLTLCAEASAIAAMVTAGKQQITEMVIIGPSSQLISPCGACRQRIAEFATANTLIHLAQNNAIVKSFTIDNLLPHSFNKKHLADCQ